MEVACVPRGPAQLWNHRGPGLDAIGIWTEKRAGRGEDAEPLLAHHEPSGRGLIGVFDGAGGAGRSPSGAHTQAWVASRVTRAATQEWFTTRPRTPLGAHLAAALRALPSTPVRVRGSLRRDYPTTLAALAYQVAGGTLTWEALWAGDSRCYLADPVLGLQQLSRDDTDEPDALSALIQDPPMHNLVHAGHFTVNGAPGGADLPCVLLCATDGFFGHLATPAEFEHVLLDTLTSAQDTTHWAALLTERVIGYTGDDATLALIALGHRGFADLRARYARRAREVRVRHAEPMARASGRDAVVAARSRSWAAYRGDYERRLP